MNPSPITMHIEMFYSISFIHSCPDYQKKLLKIQESIDGDSESFTCVEVETDAVSSRRYFTSRRFAGRKILLEGGVTARISISLHCSERGRSRTRARSEVETLSSSSLMTALGGKTFVMC